jgi:outer membrane protein assembly factor BamA
MLVENGIPGHVEYQRNNGKDERLESIAYNVAGVSIRIRHAEFPGAGAGELPLLQAAAEKLSDREYSRDYMNNFIEHDLLPIYHEHGYLKASCASARPKVIKADASDSIDNKQPPTFVEVIFPVTPGLQYKLTKWDWSGNKEIPTDQLDPLLHARAGQTANKVQLANDLREVQTLYGSRGYILAAIKVNAEFDDVAGGVAYHLAVQEGALYRMGELEFRGLDNNLTARLRAAWKIRPGEVYDATYLKQFLPQARKLLPPTLDWEVDPHVTAITRDKTVDVDLQYTAKATQ